MKMTLYLPYPSNLKLSAEVLDDDTLKEQVDTLILLFGEILKYKNDKKYIKHPLIDAYKDNINFIANFCLICLAEYGERTRCAVDIEKALSVVEFCNNNGINECVEIQYCPYYVEKVGKKYDVRKGGDAIDLLYQGKLIEKWITAKEFPKWTNREVPEFLQTYINSDKFVQEIYWKVIKRLREMRG